MPGYVAPWTRAQDDYLRAHPAPEERDEVTRVVAALGPARSRSAVTQRLSALGLIRKEETPRAARGARLPRGVDSAFQQAIPARARLARPSFFEEEDVGRLLVAGPRSATWRDGS